MTKSRGLFRVACLFLLQACSGGIGGTEEVALTREAVTTPQATVTITSNNGTDYCASVVAPNATGNATNLWKIVFDIEATTVYSSSGANLSATSHLIVATPNSSTMILPGAAATFSFCAHEQNTTPHPTVIEWNMEPSGYAACETNTGLMPTKAALAVAMGNELGRWDVADDLAVDGTTGWVTLSNTGTSRCSTNGGCPNTIALLGQQNANLASVVNQNVFNPVTYNQDLVASISRQGNLIADLTNNNPGALPPAHKLTLVGGPVNLGIGSCGPHYIFEVDNPDGTALTATQANNMANALCFYGYGGCGNNSYLSFTQTGVNCPPNRTCVAIDPTDGDNSTTSSTSAGTAPTYPMNRLYDQSGATLGTACITTDGYLGVLTSLCSTLPSTCGYGYCVATNYPCNIGGTYQHDRVYDPIGLCLGTACVTAKGVPATMKDVCQSMPSQCGYEYCMN